MERTACFDCPTSAAAASYSTAVAGSGRVPLLFLCHRIPYPPNKGDKIRAFHLLRHLSRHFDVYLASFVDDASDWCWQAEVKNYCRDLLLRPLSPWLATVRSTRGLLTEMSLSMAYYKDKVMSRWVEQVCAAHNIRHALVYSSVMAQFLPRDGEGFQRKIIDFVDVDSDKWRQYATRKPWPLSWLYRREADCLLDSERSLAARFDAGLFVSAAEAALFHRLSPSTAAKISYYNNGVDCDYFDPDGDTDESWQNPFAAGCQALVFTGAMDYWPNVDAVIWFAHNVLPALQADYPTLMFYIVGGKPTAAVRQLGTLPGVEVTGRVPDVRPYLKHCLAAVAPMRVARGVQNKVLEAMAMALPVLVSDKGLEGIEAQPGEHVLLVESSADYRRVIGELLSGRYPDMGTRARQHVLQRFDWEHNLPTVVKLLQQSGSAANG